MISSRGNKSSSRSLARATRSLALLARALTIALRASKQGTRQRSLSSTCKQVYIRGKTKLVTNTGYAFNILVGGWWREDFAWWRVGWWRGRFVVASWLVARLPGGEVTGNPMVISILSLFTLGKSFSRTLAFASSILANFCFKLIHFLLFYFLFRALLVDGLWTNP